MLFEGEAKELIVIVYIICDAPDVLYKWIFLYLRLLK